MLRKNLRKRDVDAQPILIDVDEHVDRCGPLIRQGIRLHRKRGWIQIGANAPWFRQWSDLNQFVNPERDPLFDRA